MKQNIKTKKGWILISTYLQYRAEGGKLSPGNWNDRVKELIREKGQKWPEETMLTQEL